MQNRGKRRESSADPKEKRRMLQKKRNALNIRGRNEKTSGSSAYVYPWKPQSEDRSRTPFSSSTIPPLSKSMFKQSPPPHTQRHAGSQTQMLTGQLQRRLVTPEAAKTRDFIFLKKPFTSRRCWRPPVDFVLMVHIKSMKPFNHDFL